MTIEQEAVVKTRVKAGYEIIGKKQSLSCIGDCVILTKGRHRLDINPLGYDEYTGVR